MSKQNRTMAFIHQGEKDAKIKSIVCANLPIYQVKIEKLIENKNVHKNSGTLYI